MPFRPSQAFPRWSFNQVLNDIRYTRVPCTTEETLVQELIVDEDLKIRIHGYASHGTRKLLYYASLLFSFGLLYVFYLWFPRLQLWVKYYPCPLKLAEFVYVENQYQQGVILECKSMDFTGTCRDAFCKWDVNDVSSDASTLDVPLSSLKYFEYRYFCFIQHPFSFLFVANDVWRDHRWTSVSMAIQGLEDSKLIKQRQALFHKNEIDIQPKSNSQLLLDEVLHPFFLFQIGSMVLWSLDDYYEYATCIFIISVLSIVFQWIETRQNLSKLQNLSKFHCLVRVWRLGQWKLMDSSELVPGDVFEISSGSILTIPADGVLLSGDCIMNESMLTGESLPISKSPITDLELISLDFEKEDPATLSSMSRFFLFSGTKVIRSRSPMSTTLNTPVGSFTSLNTLLPTTHMSEAAAQGALALVVRTGFNTTKGNLIRSMLFPKPNKFKFYRDSFRFIGVLSLIATLGFLCSFYNFYRMHIPWERILVRALDLFTIVVPPALPATMAIGTSFAINRLKKVSIFCISPPRVNICGKLDLMCFDKTGTLTLEGLDVYGFRYTFDSMDNSKSMDKNVSNSISTRQFSQLCHLSNDGIPCIHPSAESSLSSSSCLEDYPKILIGMACCHSIKQVHGSLVGDPMDLKMFECTKWKIHEGDALFGNLGSCILLKPPPFSEESKKLQPMLLIKTFDFVSGLRRMSVIVKTCNSENLRKSFCESEEFEVFVKGAPEVIRSICHPQSLPSNYDLQMKYYAHHGYRVIALASRLLKQSPLGILNSKRSEIEKDLLFLGFLVFENKLKPGTSQVIHSLHQAGIRQVMVTGDNVLTSISVSKECGLIPSASRVYIPHFEVGTASDADAKIAWENVVDDVPKKTVDPNSFLETDGIHSKYSDEYCLAITGDVFSWMLDFASESTISKMLLTCHIYARMSPDQKHFLVERLQNLGYCVGFTGDGSNDCGALKNSDVGLSLSEAEASVAAPFTSQDKELSCVLNMIREGRGALVTSFSCFKYMALYSLIQFTTVSLLYSQGNNLGDGQYMYIDLFVIVPIAVFMGQSKPSQTLSVKRPTASLVSKKVLTSLIGQILIQSGIQMAVFAWTCRSFWYSETPHPHQEAMYESMDNTILFYLSSFQYMIVAFVYNKGPPFRESVYKNVPFILSLLGLWVFSTLILFTPMEWISKQLQLVEIPWHVKKILYGIILLDFLVSWFFEMVAFAWIAELLDRILWRLSAKRNDPMSGWNGEAAMQLAKWKRKGKWFKIVRHDMEQGHETDRL